MVKLIKNRYRELFHRSNEKNLKKCKKNQKKIQGGLFIISETILDFSHKISNQESLFFYLEKKMNNGKTKNGNEPETRE